ncbi:MAG: hypothetical protein M3P18_15825 [Actinomycetota bacterium]|nr:hypothetical protein [Actinomycetota bacterium]
MQADWSDVLRRAGEGEAGRVVPRRFRKRRLVVAFVVLAAVLIPLAALAATNDWWFFESGTVPKPLSAPVVVKEGEWSGHAWQLIAYPSGTDGLCVSVTPKGRKDVGTMGCSPFVGVSRTAATKASPDMPITYLAGSGPEGRPAYIVGPVIDKASEVEIRFANGQTLRVRTFSAPAPLPADHRPALELGKASRSLERRRGFDRGEAEPRTR